MTFSRGKRCGRDKPGTSKHVACDLMVAAIPVPPSQPHPSSVERRSRGKWLQTAPQEPKAWSKDHTSHFYLQFLSVTRWFAENR